jgi:hypothetical protein
MQNRLHKLKTLKEYYDAVALGIKNFEVRKNDRDFHQYDFLELISIDENGYETGRSIIKSISYIYHGEIGGLQEGYVVLGLKELTDYQYEVLAGVKNDK